MAYKLKQKYIDELDDLIYAVNVNSQNHYVLYTETITNSINSWNQFQTTRKALKEILKPDYQLPKKYLKQLEKTVSDFNQKNASLSRPTFDISLPSAVSMIHSYNDFRSLNSTLKQFLKPNATQMVRTVSGYPIMKWEQNLINTVLPKLQKNKDRQIPLHKRENPDPLDQDVSNARVRDPTTFVNSRLELLSQLLSDLRQSLPGYVPYKAQIYKNNYMRRVLAVEDGDVRAELLSLINSISPSAFYEAGLGDPVLSISYLYYNKYTGSRLDTLADDAIFHWRMYKNG